MPADFNVEAYTADTVTDNGVAFTSTGTVAVSSGTLALDDPGGTDSGSFTVALNATLAFGETATTLSPQSSVSGDGNVVFDNNGTTTIDGGYSIGSLDALGLRHRRRAGLGRALRVPPPHVRVRDDGPDDGAVHPDFNDGSAHELTDCRSGGNHLRRGERR